ncbi:Pyridoxal-5'-phosphate-dependent enzyme, beta subunit, partial [mine drainage metagenome]
APQEGRGVTVTDDEILRAQSDLRRQQGVSVCPDGGGRTWAAVPRLLERGRLRPDETVLLYNTGSGLLYGRD